MQNLKSHENLPENEFEHLKRNMWHCEIIFCFDLLEKNINITN